MRRSALTPPATTPDPAGPGRSRRAKPAGAEPAPPRHRPGAPRPGRRRLITTQQLREALPAAVRKLRPRTMARNPVMLVAETGSALTTLTAVVHPSVFAWMISFWLCLTVLFANLAEAVAESPGKAQADSLRQAQAGTTARRLLHWRVGSPDRRHESIPAEHLLLHDIVLVPAGEVVPATAR
ncbi:hypothetical protein [Kitasatospora sp. NPDC050467]|uniref:hypothetical protein n=1 Tax=unclassified Kitasatospora TaxID=2633591 RepID=UPI00378D2036